MRFNITPAASRDMASIADDLADRVGLGWIVAIVFYKV